MSAAIDRVLAALRANDCRPRRSGKGWACRCPAHDDERPSLSVEGVDGLALVHCFVGCSVERICAAIGLRLADLFDDPRSSATAARRSVSRRTPTVKTRPAPRDHHAGDPGFDTLEDAAAELERRHGPASRIDQYQYANGERAGATWRRYLTPKASWAKRKKITRPIARFPDGRWRIAAIARAAAAVPPCVAAERAAQ